METEIVTCHSLFFKVRMTGVHANVLNELYGHPNNSIAYGWDLITEWGCVTVMRDYKTGEVGAWYMLSDGDTAMTAVERVLDEIYEAL